MPKPGQKPDAPPHNIEAEQSTLGAMLLDSAAFSIAAEILERDDFYRPAHQVLFDAILALSQRGEPVDLITVQEELRSRDSLDTVGGIGYLTVLFDTVPTTANVEHYAQIVKQKAVLRRVQEQSERFSLLASKNGIDPSALLTEWQKAIDAALAQAGDAISGAAQRRAPKRKSIAERTIDLADVPPPSEDDPGLLGPYFRPGVTHWLTGQTGVGKTTFIFNIACALAEGRETLWEQPCLPCKVLYADLESGDNTRARKIERLYQGTPRARGRLLFLREPVKFPEELGAFLAYVEQEGFGLVVFDTARRAFSVKDENDNAEVYNRVVPTLDALKAAGVASLVLGHPAKNGNGSARGAGAQEDAGDVNLSLTLHRGEANDADAVLKLCVTKHRVLGLGIPPLYLRRVGDDHFESVDVQEANARTGGEETTEGDKPAQCQEAILEYLQHAPEGRMTHTALKQAMTERGFRKWSFDKALKVLREGGEVINADGSYHLPDPFSATDFDEE